MSTTKKKTETKRNSVNVPEKIAKDLKKIAVDYNMSYKRLLESFIASAHLAITNVPKWKADDMIADGEQVLNTFN